VSCRCPCCAARALLDPLAKLETAIELVRAELPRVGEELDQARHERIGLARETLCRAVVFAHRAARDLKGLELVGCGLLAEAEQALRRGRAALGRTGGIP